MDYVENLSTDVKIKVTYNPTPIETKPKGSEVGKITKGLKSVGTWTIPELVRFTQPPYSYTIAPATFVDNHRKNSKWLSQQLFLLDFDSGIEVTEVYERFEEQGISPNFYYYTFSHRPDTPRFRVGLVVDEEVNDSKLASFIRRGLVLAFPEADQSCKDASRIFFPGSHSVETNSNPVKLELLYEFTSLQILAKDNYKKRQLMAENAVPFINKKGGSGFDQKSPNSSLKNPKRLEYLRNFSSSGVTVAGLAGGKLKIFDDFILGKHLPYHQLRGLATNLQYIRGGQKLYFNTLEATGTYKDCDYAVFHYVKNYEYYPTRLENFSPYPEDHRYSDLLEVLKTPHHIQQVAAIPKVPLNDAEEMLEYEFEKALKADDNYVYIFKTATGIGKTKLLEGIEGVAVCFPNHQLKDEADRRFSSDHVCVPKKPVFKLERLNQLIEHYYQLGLNAEVRKLIQQVARMENGFDEYPEDVDSAHAYLIAEREVRSTSKTILSTHKRGLFDTTYSEVLIFDEDPLNSILELEKCKLNDLKSLEFDLKYSTIKPIIEELEGSDLDRIYQSNTGNVNLDEVSNAIKDSEGLNSNLLRFFQSSSYCRSSYQQDVINYCVRQDLPNNCKVIIMSATAKVEAYKALYGERVKVIDISNVEQAGKVIQFSDRSYSRTSIESLSKEALMERFKGEKVITFERYKDLIENAVEGMYFHNTEGFDSLKGQDLTVFGSPHLPEIVYKFYAHEFGWEVSNAGYEMKTRLVERNGFRFPFTTFGDVRLQNLQLDLVESEILQAVGRARTLRTPAVVKVYSNLPLALADEIYMNLSNGKEE